MRELSGKIAGIAPSATMAISNEAKKMQAAGIDVISLSIGEPDFDTPDHIKEACIDALRRGETHYAPSNGLPELNQAIACEDREGEPLSLQERGRYCYLWCKRRHIRGHGGSPGPW